MNTAERLAYWFQKNKRSFPWRDHPSPYEVFVSEVMLQQTRASVVIPYFEKWMQLFPDISSLAQAPLDKVIKAWEGLGYYRRAKNLHLAAQKIVRDFASEIPSSRKDLESIKGLGPYTVGALLSFGFKKRALAIDGNVARVITRFYAIEENICKRSTQRKIEEKVENLLDEKEPWITSEALIELGATLCTPKNPLCEMCPLQKDCLGKEKAELLPVRNQREKTTFLQRWVLILKQREAVLLKKEEEGKVMAGLYQFPFLEKGKNQGRKDLESLLLSTFGVKVRWRRRLPLIKHSFTRFQVTLFPLEFEVLSAEKIEGHEWVHQNILETLAFSSGHRRVLHFWKQLLISKNR